MSATLDAQGIAKYLGDCRTLLVPGSKFPISIEYLSSGTGRARDLETSVRDAVVEALSRPDAEKFGHLLVFLPGMAEIRRSAQALEADSRRFNFDVFPLHGELSREEQERAIQPSKPGPGNPLGRTKVILSTNVAETSLTLPGVNTVIDSGLARVASYSSWSGLPSLKTKAVSKASAIQRAGRSGRTSPGRCFRLYSKGEFDGKASFEIPEILRADLCQSLLELSTMGIQDPSDPLKFEWFQAPPPQALSSARSLAEMLGALDSSGKLTPLGHQLAELPVHPRLGKLILEGVKRGVSTEAIEMASLLSEAKNSPGSSLDLLREFDSYQPGEAGRKLIQQLSARMPSNPRPRMNPPQDRELQLKLALLSAFPDRVARKKSLEKGSVFQLVISSGGSVTVEQSAVVNFAEYFVIPALQESQGLGQLRSSLRVRSLFSIEPEWLFDLEPSGITETDEMSWDADRKRVFQLSMLSYGQLILSQSKGVPSDAPAVRRKAAELLAVQVSKFLKTHLPSQEALKEMRVRLSLLKKHSGLELPEFPGADDAAFSAPLLEVCLGKTSWSEIQSEIDAESLVSGLVQSWLALQDQSSLANRLDREVPLQTVLARGRKVKIHYVENQAPWIESRIQDYFGMSDGPKILGGKLALTLHLLAPNYRAVQVTSDLKGFWVRSYAEVRRELGRRYPRHSWPEDPLQAFVEKSR